MELMDFSLESIGYIRERPLYELRNETQLEFPGTLKLKSISSLFKCAASIFLSSDIFVLPSHLDANLVVQIAQIVWAAFVYWISRGAGIAGC